MAEDLPSGVNPKGDKRSRKFVLVIECILNQNARISGAAAWPAMNRELIEVCNRHGAGIVQIPCPEMACLGWARKTAPGLSLLEGLEQEPGRSRLLALCAATADRVQDYLVNGYRPLAVLGGNPKSPGCAVHHEGNGLAARSGAFMRFFHEELRRRGLEIPFRGVRDYDPKLMAEDIEWLDALLARS